jgi:PadR family transcriptional regulator PadR
MDSPLNAKTTLLQALEFADGYGLELIERVRAWTDGRIVLHQGSVYPALRSLERDGLVHSYEYGSLSDKGGRPRIYYSLTEEGKGVAREQIEIVSSLFRHGQ